MNIPADELRKRLEEVPKGKPVYAIFQSDLRSCIASQIFTGNGYEAYNFSGDYSNFDMVRNDRTMIALATACGMDK